jgi:hypothetical protein
MPLQVANGLGKSTASRFGAKGMKIGLIQEIYIGEECLSPWQLSAMLLQLRRKASCKRIKGGGVFRLPPDEKEVV